MAKDILRMYGPDSANPQAKRATCGGVKMKDTVEVFHHAAPSIPGYNHFKSIGPGLGGKVYSSGTQGQRSPQGTQKGGPGLSGRNLGPGVNRKG